MTNPSDSPSRPAPPAPPADAAHRATPAPWARLRSAHYHPFIYRKMIDEIDPRARPGDVVTILDRSGSVFGAGIYNPHSLITLRVLTYGDAPVDGAFWTAAVRRALDLRRRLALDQVTDAYRLIHAEGDGLSGLVVERYADCLAFEMFSLGMFQRFEQLAVLIASELGPPASLDRPGRPPPGWRAVMRVDEYTEQREGFHAPPPRVVSVAPSGLSDPDLPAERGPARDAPDRAPGRPAGGLVTIREHGVRYRVDLLSGQKTGFFCDQRENRRRFAGLCGGAEVLDLCCYSAGFGLCAALLGGAREVTCVDLDEAAVALARQNVNLNHARIGVVQADAFVYLRQLIAAGRQFDAVVLDPPKLALSKAAIDEALGKYRDLNRLAMQVVRPGGVLLTCSCSGLVSRHRFIETLRAAARAAGRAAQMFDLTGAGPDHPVMLNCPESTYLKAAWLRIH